MPSRDGGLWKDDKAAPAAILDALADTTARIKRVVKQLSAAQLTTAPAAGGWSPNEILWHIRATADVYGEHITRIIEEDEPRWRHVSPRARMRKSRYDELPFAESFAAFERQRSELLARLRSIAPEAWQRIAIVRVPDYESEWRLTLHERVRGMARHEQGHCAQMEQAAAALRKLS